MVKYGLKIVYNELSRDFTCSCYPVPVAVVFEFYYRPEKGKEREIPSLIIRDQRQKVLAQIAMI